MAGLAAEVRGELGQVSEAHERAGRQLQQQGTQVAELAVDVTRARMGVESVEERVAKLEKTAALAVRLLWIVLVFVLMGFAILVVRGLKIC